MSSCIAFPLILSAAAATYCPPTVLPITPHFHVRDSYLSKLSRALPSTRLYPPAPFYPTSLPQQPLFLSTIFFAAHATLTWLDFPVQVVATFTGSVWEVKVAEGARVSEGDDIVVLEAMKLEHPIPAPVAGVVKHLLVEP